MLTDAELQAVRYHTGTFHVSMWRGLYSAILGRPITPGEVTDAHARLFDTYYLAHPEDRPSPTYANLLRDPSATLTFWR